MKSSPPDALLRSGMRAPPTGRAQASAGVRLRRRKCGHASGGNVPGKRGSGVTGPAVSNRRGGAIRSTTDHSRRRGYSHRIRHRASPDRPMLNAPARLRAFQALTRPGGHPHSPPGPPLPSVAPPCLLPPIVWCPFCPIFFIEHRAFPRPCRPDLSPSANQASAWHVHRTARHSQRGRGAPRPPL